MRFFWFLNIIIEIALFLAPGSGAPLYNKQGQQFQCGTSEKVSGKSIDVHLTSTVPQPNACPGGRTLDLTLMRSALYH